MILVLRDILLANGTAADAAIAGLFCDGVINTQSMGLGGGFLLTYYHRYSAAIYHGYIIQLYITLFCHVRSILCGIDDNFVSEIPMAIVHTM